jgi:hypothetical protein
MGHVLMMMQVWPCVLKYFSQIGQSVLQKYFYIIPVEITQPIKLSLQLAGGTA